MDGDLTSLNVRDQLSHHPVLVLARKLVAGEATCPGELELWRGIVDEFLRQQLSYATWWMRLANCEPRMNDPLARVPRPTRSASQLWQLRQVWQAMGERYTIRERWLM